MLLPAGTITLLVSIRKSWYTESFPILVILRGPAMRGRPWRVVRRSGGAPRRQMKWRARRWARPRRRAAGRVCRSAYGTAYGMPRSLSNSVPSASSSGGSVLIHSRCAADSGWPSRRAGVQLAGRDAGKPFPDALLLSADRLRGGRRDGQPSRMARMWHGQHRPIRILMSDPDDTDAGRPGPDAALWAVELPGDDRG